MVVWVLSEDSLKILDVNPSSNRATVRLDLRLLSPMTEAEAKKFIDNNFPDGGSVKKAAAILGISRSI